MDRHWYFDWHAGVRFPHDSSIAWYKHTDALGKRRNRWLIMWGKLSNHLSPLAAAPKQPINAYLGKRLNCGAMVAVRTAFG